MSLHLEIISPQEILYNEEVDLVIFPGIEGDFGILKKHMPLLTYLRMGIIYLYKEKKLINSFLVNGGIVEVSKDSCTLLTEDIVDTKNYKPDDINENVTKLKSKLVSKFYYS
jgi:F-type H+-transporting ATPase subunit epsilon